MDIATYRAGRYEAQFEYQSFLPEPIHHAWVMSDPDVLTLNSEADRRLGELNAFAQLVPDIEFFIKMYVAKETTRPEPNGKRHSHRRANAASRVGNARHHNRHLRQGCH